MFDAFRILPGNVFQGLLAANAPDALNPFATIADVVASSVNIYNSDGSLTANRTVTQATFSLSFTGGDIGMGAAAVANTRLFVKGAGNTTGTIGFETQNLAGTSWFRVYNEGTFWSQGLSDVAHLITTFGNSMEVRYSGVTTSTFSMQVNGSTVCSFINQTNLSRFNMSSGQDWGVYGSDNNPYLLFDESTKRVVIGATSGVNSIFEVTGDIEVIAVGDGFILKSPDGTRWKIEVDNAGAISTSLA